MSPGLQTHTATIQRGTTTADSYGGHSIAWAAVYTDIPGSLQPARGRIVEEFARRGMHISHSFYTTTEIALTARDRLVCDSTNYIVVAFGDMAGRGSHFVAHLLQKD